MLEFAQIAIGGLVVGSIYAAIALGFSLVYRVTGAINLSQGGFALIAAMIGYTFGVAWGWPLVVAIPAAVATTVIIGVGACVLYVRAGADAAFQCQCADADRRPPHHDRGIFARGLGQPALCDAAVLGRATAGLWCDPDSDAGVLGVRRDRFVHRRALVSHRQDQTRQGSSRLRRKSVRREPDGHRRAADDAVELWPGDADRGDLRRHRRADYLAAIRYRTPVHDFRFRCGGDRRHRFVSRRGDRRALSRAGDAALDRLHLIAVFERDLASHSAGGADLAAAGSGRGRRRAATGYPRRGEGRGPCRQTPGASCLAAGGDRGGRGRIHSIRHHRQRHHEWARDCRHPVHDADGARRADGLCRAGQPWPVRLHGDRRLHVGLSRDQHRDRAGALDPRGHRRLGSLRAGALGGDITLARTLSRARHARLRAPDRFLRGRFPRHHRRAIRFGGHSLFLGRQASLSRARARCIISCWRSI